MLGFLFCFLPQSMVGKIILKNGGSKNNGCTTANNTDRRVIFIVIMTLKYQISPDNSITTWKF